MLWCNLEEHWRKILGIKYYRYGVWDWKHTPDSVLSGFSKPTHAEGSLPPNRALHKCCLCHYAVFQKLHHYSSPKGWRKAKYWSFLWMCTKRVFNWVLPIKAHFHRLFFNPINFWGRREGEIICKARFKQVLNRSRQLASDPELTEFLGKKMQSAVLDPNLIICRRLCKCFIWAALTHRYWLPVFQAFCKLYEAGVMFNFSLTATGKNKAI